MNKWFFPLMKLAQNPLADPMLLPTQVFHQAQFYSRFEFLNPCNKEMTGQISRKAGEMSSYW